MIKTTKANQATGATSDYHTNLALKTKNDITRQDLSHTKN